MSYCNYCGGKSEKIEIPRETGEFQFDEETGNRIIETKYRCFNANCSEGRENICLYLKNGHSNGIVLWGAIIISLISIILIFLLDNILFILGVPLALIFYIIFNKCLYCGYRNDY